MASIDRLREFEVFKKFTDDELTKICSLLQDVSVSDDEVIIDEKSTNSAIYLVFSGQVKIFRDLPGSTTFLTVLEPNDIFGEVSFIDKMTRSASARSVGNARLGMFTFENFKQIQQENPNFCVEFLLELMKELTRKFRAISEGLDVKSTEYTINELIASGKQVKISTASGADYLCTIKYSDRTQNFPLLKIDIKGQIIIIPYFQVKAIVLPNKYGSF